MPRSGNFLKEDTEILLNLTERYHDIVNNKRTDHVTNKQKEECWIKISQLFNAATRGEKRESKQLKNHWQNIIYRTKNEYSDQRQHQLKTGGPVLSRVFDAQVEPNLNPYDDDDAILDSSDDDDAILDSSDDDAILDSSKTLDVIAADEDIVIKTIQFASSTITSTPGKSIDGAGRPKCARVIGTRKVEEEPTTSNKKEKNMNGLPSQQGTESVKEKIYQLAEVEHWMKVALLKAKLQGVKRKAERDEELHRMKVALLKAKLQGVKRKAERDEELHRKKVKEIKSSDVSQKD